MVATRTTAAGLSSSHTALDIDEFFSTEVCSEASFCRHSRIWGASLVASTLLQAMSNIGKWSAVDDGRSMLQGLHQVWMNGIFKDGSHSTARFEVFGCHLDCPC